MIKIRLYIFCIAVLGIFWLGVVESWSLGLGFVPKFGLGLSYPNGLDAYRTSFSLEVGLGLELYLRDPFSLEMDFIYQRNSAKFSKGTFHFEYFSIPLKFKIRVIDQLVFFTGPNFSLLLSSKSNTGKDLKAWTRPWNISFILGFQYSFVVNSLNRIRFELFLDLGFQNLRKEGHPLVKKNFQLRSFFFVMAWEFRVF